MKSRDGKSQRREEKRREEERISKRESLRRKKIQVREKVGKGRDPLCFFPMICGSGGSGGSKSRLAKAAGTETSGEMRDEKLHAAVARSTFASQKAKNTSRLDHFWKLRCQKSAHHCGAKHISKSTCAKHLMFGPLLEVEMSKKCTPLWREAHFEVKMHKTHHVRTTFGRSDLVSRGRHKGLRTLSKVRKTWGFCSISKTMAGVGHLKRICKTAFSVAGAVQETCSSEMLGGQGADFWEGLHFGASNLQVCSDNFAWQVQHFVWPGINFSWQAQYFRQVEWKNRKTHWYEAVSSALNFPFLKEVLQNCFIFDVVISENWGSLADLFRFWCCMSSSKLEEVSQNCFRFGCCQVQKLRKSRRIASFSSLQIDR